MWSCPRCGRLFTRPHQTHSCGHFTVDAFLKGRTRLQVDLYRRFEKLALAVGDVNLAPAKGRIGFQHGRIFAAANGFSSSGLRAHVVTRAPIKSARILRSEAMAPDCYLNQFLIRSADDVDEEVELWLRRGYQWA